MPSQEMQLHIQVDESEADDERLDTLTRTLMQDLRGLGGASVSGPGGAAAPEGAKGDPFTVGALVMVVAPALLPMLVDFLQAWSLRGEDEHRRVKIKAPNGVEVEFLPEKRLTSDEIAELTDRLMRAGT